MFTVRKKKKKPQKFEKYFFPSANQRWVVFDPIGLKGLKSSTSSRWSRAFVYYREARYSAISDSL